MVVGGCRSSVAEHWQLKPEALGSICSDTTYSSPSFTFHRSSDSNDPDYLSLDDLYWSLDLVESCPSGSLCCDDAQILTKS